MSVEQRVAQLLAEAPALTAQQINGLTRVVASARSELRATSLSKPQISQRRPAARAA